MIKSKKVLVCDVCETEQVSDDPTETLGVLIESGSYHADHGGGGMTKVFICFDCSTGNTLMELVWALPEPKPKRRSRKAKTKAAHATLMEVTGNA